MPSDKSKLPLKTISDPKAKRRCPYCGSNKWIWIKTLPIDINKLGRQLEMLYRCEKCNKDFIATERAQAKLVKSADICVICNSTHLQKISKPDADLELYQCKMCHCYLGIAQIK